MNNNKTIRNLSVGLGILLVLFVISFAVGYYALFPSNMFYVIVVLGMAVISLSCLILIFCASQILCITPAPKSTPRHRVVLKYPEESYLTLVPDEYKDYREEIQQRELKERKGLVVDIVA